ncbi:MAG TPA: hypothetical protein VMR18_01555 [Candidatus Saccharimonadales bacterium]|nr:hypothetical protein [Candidatus Saccharimonadales bacterium]
MTHNQQGSVNTTILLVVSIFLLVLSVVFGVWAYGSRQDYKNNVSQKVAVAVAGAKNQTEATDAAQYALKAEKPLDTYVGPQAFGSIIIKYPKNWSGYVAEDATSQTPIDGYFNPGVVPNIASTSSVFALRVQVINQSYATEVSTFTQPTQQQQIKVTPYKLPSNPNITGVMINGQFTTNDQSNNSVNGSMVILPLLNSTIELWTESPQFENDFDNNILPNFSFSQ